MSYLPKEKEIAIIAQAIIVAHYGQACFNQKETGMIIDLSPRYVDAAFDEAGVLSIQIGTSKRYTAVAIAERLLFKKISPMQPIRKKRKKSKM